MFPPQVIALTVALIFAANYGIIGEIGSPFMTVTIFYFVIGYMPAPSPRGGAKEGMMNVLRRQTGQGLVEHALIIALVGVVVIVALLLVGPGVGNVFRGVSFPPGGRWDRKLPVCKGRARWRL